ncbi:MAG: penicillin-binding protein 2 [Patescibacteria group bacterium]
MWRDRRTNNRGAVSFQNNRLHLVIAIIFLLCAALIYKLFNLQIKQCDWYTALASSQHQINSQLKPDRGRILISDRLSGQDDKLYPLASSKDFAFLYAVPKDITQAPELAEKLFEFFDLEGLKQLKPEQEIKTDSQASSSETALPESDFDRQKEELIKAYLAKLDKPGDPYEPLKNKLSTEDLLRLYAFLSGRAPGDLEIKNQKVVSKNDGQEVSITGLGFDFKKYRYYPDNNIGAHFLGFVSYVDEEEKGRYGLEEFFNDELFGKYGSLKSERGGTSEVVIVNDREYVKPEAGSDLVLTIDRSVQFAACEKLSEAVKKHGADGGSVIIVEPQSGAILAMCSVPDFNPNNYKEIKDLQIFNNPIISHQYEPGSVFKTITMAAALDQGKVSPSTTYQDPGQMMIKGWNKPISNSDFSTKGAHGLVDMNFVLENSLNTGSIFAMRTIGAKVFSDYVKNFGFGERSGLELGSEANGNIDNLLKNKIKEIDAATASFGQGISVTPLQMVMAYSALANRGELMKPYLVKTIVRPDGHRDEVSPKMVRKVVSEKTAATILAMLANVVESGHSKRAALSGYYIGGKTGTAQVAEGGGYAKDRYIHTFVGIAPIDSPRFVMLTKIDNPKDVEYAEGSVVPLWRDIADFLLKYYQVPKTKAD